MRELGVINLSRALVLWDVDHTLIENGGVSKETYAEAFRLLTGEVAKERPQTDGRTDPVIMRDLFASNGVEFTELHDRELFGALIEAGAANREELRRRGHALPGAEEVLRCLAEDATVVQSVLTGNIVQNARGKLEPFGLDKYLDFEVGGFGSDHRDRPQLVGVAQARATGKYGVEFQRSNTFIVGDTVRDVNAGVNGGAQVIGVATGIDSIEALRQAGADAVLAGLTDVEVFLAALRKLRETAT